MSTTGYLSDCTSAYANQNSGGGDYPNITDACQNCTTGSQYYTNNGYTLGGSCANAPANQDGNGYVSDCTNYYYEESPSPMDLPDAQQACQACASYTSVIQGNGYNSLAGSCPEATAFSQGGNGMAVSALNILNSAVTGGAEGVDQAEYFTLFPKKSSGYIWVLLVLIILIVLGFFMYKRHTKTMNMRCCGY